jgi:hypothetical protein
VVRVSKDERCGTAELMDAHDVSAVVNSAKYDGPECIQPVSGDEIPRTGQLSCVSDTKIT